MSNNKFDTNEKARPSSQRKAETSFIVEVQVEQTPNFTKTKRELITMATKNLASSLMPQLSFTISRVMPVIWAVAYLLFISMLFYQTWMTIADYFSHPTVVSISIERSDEPIEFPAITICNNNMIRKSLIARSTNLKDLAFLDYYMYQRLEIQNNPDLFEERFSFPS